VGRKALVAAGPVRYADRGEMSAMWEQSDIGLKGLAVLAAYSLAFGILAQVVMWRSVTHWMWLIAAATFFVAGLLISEVWFGWATEADLQPNIDGLSRDEALLAVFPAVIAVYITWAIGRRHHARHRPIHA
jgi:phosphatidylserine synthase